MLLLDIIVAVDSENGIGKKGELPWHLSGDMKHFRDLTTAVESKGKKNAVIMGRKTWDSLPPPYKPLPHRLNIVLTRGGLSLPDGVFQAASLNEALGLINDRFQNVVEKVFVIGGGEIFKEALTHPQCHKIYLTQILSKFDCATFFPSFSHLFQNLHKSPHQQEGSLEYYFAEYVRKK